MGRLPPSPPGAMLILEPGVEYHEITCIEDSERRFIPAMPYGKPAEPFEYIDWQRKALLDAEAAAVRRYNAWGFAALVGLVLAAANVAARLVGLL